MGSVDKAAFSQEFEQRFSATVSERLGAALPAAQRSEFLAIAREALHETIESFGTAGTASAHNLPVTRLKPAQVIAQGKTNLSQASLYRAADSQRFYSVTPGGRSIGKEFPAWQFVDPVPELIADILAELGRQPGSDIHVFWTGAADELNELTPAELLAGLPFETRGPLHASQKYLLGQSATVRQKKVKEFAQQQSRSVAGIIS